jgi:hypothetical protein
MSPLRIGDRISFEDAGGGSRQGTVKAFNLSSLRAEVEVDARTVEVEITSITLVNGSPVKGAK